MFDWYNPGTWNECENPDAQAVVKGVPIFDTITKKPITAGNLIHFLGGFTDFCILSGIQFSSGKFLDRLARFNSFEAVNEVKKAEPEKKDWISDDIKAMRDSAGNPLSRERQGRIQIIRDSVFPTLKKVPDDIKAEIKKIFLDCLEKRLPKNRIKQELFDSHVAVNYDLYDFVDYEYSSADSLAYMKDIVFNSRQEKVYFRRIEMNDCCSKCRKLDGKIALWSGIPLDSNFTDDEYADYVIWDDRKTDRKSGIPLTNCCGHCRGGWVECFPETEEKVKNLMSGR